MRNWLAVAALLAACVGLAVWAAPANASGDYGCQHDWKLESPSRACLARIAIAPGNDTRVNLLLLLRERAGLPVTGTVVQREVWRGDDFGETFFDWDLLADTLYPATAHDEATAFPHSRCQSVEQGGAQFMAAVARNRQIRPGDRDRLAQGRASLVALCEADGGQGLTQVPQDLGDLALPRLFAGQAAREFGTYIAGAAAFYAGDWRSAQARFVQLRRAQDAWVRETARYMEARSLLGQVAAQGVDEWGFFDQQAIDGTLAQQADRALDAYLSAYPTGHYAASARGLQRRAAWLGGVTARQATGYAQALASTDPASDAAAALVEEIDNKFLLRPDAGAALDDPLLLATHDLMRMRRYAEPIDPEFADNARNGLPLLTAEELVAQQAAFADQPALFAFLQAAHAFHVDQDYRRVLALLPDDARRARYSPLQFSGQVLRGMALARLGDRNEVGFWRDLLAGSQDLFQRSTVELGLALAWQRDGQVAQVFAEDSPIRNERIRALLREYSAGPQVLRAVASGTARTAQERDLAAFMLLYRALRHGDYAAAQADLALVPADGPVTAWDEETYEPRVPVGVFVRGAVEDGYACPPLPQTIARLARNGCDVRGRLCLGDFFRLNQFDNSEHDFAPGEGALGSVSEYPGQATPRSRYYADIIVEPGVGREDRAYALYRAIRCYAPARNNSCGGDDVPPQQRAAWFRRLKGEFGDTRWAQEAQYYW